MTIALTDLLIELSDPNQAAAFKRDPEKFLTAFGLTEEDKKAFYSRDILQIRCNARSTESSDPTQQFNRHARALLMIDIMHYHLEQTDLQAITDAGCLFVDVNGTYYQAVREE